MALEKMVEIAERYHELEREEIENNVLGVFPGVIDEISVESPETLMDSYAARDTLNIALKRTRRSFCGDDETARAAMAMIETIAGRKDGFKEFVDIYFSGYSGAEEEAGPETVKILMGMLGGALKNLSPFEKHYEEVAKQVIRIAGERSMAAEEAVEDEGIRDEALRSVLKTRDEYERFAKEDVAFLGTMISLYKEDDDISGGYREQLESIAKTLPEKLAAYHEENAGRLYGGV